MDQTMSPREVFKAAFLLKAAEAGYGPDDLEPLVAAAEVKLGIKQAVLGDLVAAGKDLGGLGLAGLAAPAIGLGMAGGVAYNALTSPKVNPDEIKRDELIDNYRFYTDRLAEKRKARLLAAAQSRPRGFRQ